MVFKRSTTVALASLGGIIGAIVTNQGKARSTHFSKERTIGAMLGMGAGLAVGQLMESTQPGLSGLALSDDPGTPLKRQPITIIRTDAAPRMAAPTNSVAVVNKAARPLIADRILS